MQKCIENYFNDVWLPWVNGNRSYIENKYSGVHEFKPEFRGECYTSKFDMKHPKAIEDSMDDLIAKFKRQLGKYNE